MSAVVDFVEDAFEFVGDVIEDVGDVISDVVEVAVDVVEDVGDFVGNAVEAALDDPVGTIAKVAAVATGNAWALPYISAGSVIVNGGSLEDAIIAGGTTYIAQGVVDYINAPAPGSLDYGPSIPDTSVTPYTIVPGDFDYGPPNITVEDLYRQYAGREADPGGLAFWEAGFGDTIDANEIASFQQAVADARAAGTEPQPVAPGEAPYDPYTDEGPSQPNPNVPTAPGDAVPDAPEIEVVGPRPPGDTVPDLGEITITGTRPVVPDLGEIVITGTRPPPDDDVPEIVITAPYTPPPVDSTVVPVDVTPPVDVTTPPVDVTTPPVDLTPYIPILVTPPAPPRPPPITPRTPYVPPAVTPNVIGNMLNPGYIKPTAFYNTTDPAQSQFYWGGHGPQFGPEFNAEAYNQVAAPDTPFGIPQVAGPLSPEDYAAIAAGTYQPPAAQAPATRAEAYRAPTQTAPSYGQVQVGGPVAPAATVGGRSSSMYTPEQIAYLNYTLGPDWQARQERAALDGDYSTIVDIGNQINRALAPVSETPS